MEHDPNVSYLIGKAIRRGTASYTEVREATAAFGTAYADSVVSELDAAGVKLIEEQEVLVTSETNVLMNQLPLVGLIALALRLPPVPKLARRLYGLILSSRSRELDLKRLGYLDSDKQSYYLSPGFSRLQHLLRQLLDTSDFPFCADWRKWTEIPPLCLLQIVSHPRFQETILPNVRGQYLGLPSSASLIGWVRSTALPAPTMMEIIAAGLGSDRPQLVRQVLFASEASTADGRLRAGKDICFSCPSKMRNYALADQSWLFDLLSEYRYSDLDALVQARHPQKSWQESVTGDCLISKFFVPYMITARAKRFMIDIGVVARTSRVLDKSHGQYCPREDRWALVAAAF